MARVRQTEADGVVDRNLGVVVHRNQMGQGFLYVRDCVKRLYRRFAVPLALAVFVFGVGLLDMAGIEEHDPQELAGHCRGIDPAPEALLDQQGQTPGVVDVGMRDDHVVNMVCRKGEYMVIRLIPSLLETAVHQQMVSCHGQTVAGAGHSPVSAVKIQLHCLSRLLFIIISHLLGNANPFPPAGADLSQDTEAGSERRRTDPRQA